MQASLDRSARTRPAPPAGPRLDGLVGDLERAAVAIARLDAALRGQPLQPAWVWRARLEAVRRQAAVDGRVIDPWQLAAVVEGLRFRIGHGASLAERGAVFDAARHALALWRWFVRPDAEQAAAIAAATAALPALGRCSVLLGAAHASHRWLDGGGARPPLRAALAGYWRRCGLLAVPAPLLTGAGALAAGTPWRIDGWSKAFLAALADEAALGLALLRQIERPWRTARAAVAKRRRDSHAAAAVDVLAMAPVVSATTLAQALGISIKSAAALLDDLRGGGLIIEVSQRAKRRLYALADLAPLRTATLAPRRPQPGRKRGRPRREGAAAGDEAALSLASGPVLPAPASSPRQGPAFDFTDLDRFMREAELAIRRTETLLAR